MSGDNREGAHRLGGLDDSRGGVLLARYAGRNHIHSRKRLTWSEHLPVVDSVGESYHRLGGNLRVLGPGRYACDSSVSEGGAVFRAFGHQGYLQVGVLGVLLVSVIEVIGGSSEEHANLSRLGHLAEALLLDGGLRHSVVGV